MRLKIWVVLLTFFSVTAFAQKSALRGIVVDAASSKPVTGVVVLLQDRQTSVVTNDRGAFLFEELTPGLDILSLSSPQVASKQLPVTLNNGLNDLGSIPTTAIEALGFDESTVFVFSETQIDEDESQNQAIATLMGASDDIYLRKASFAFSPARFSVRGYSQEHSDTYINGVSFNDGVRGRFNFSSLGGMNTLFRQKDIANYTDASTYGFGAIGGATNIISRASKMAAGSNFQLGATNRSYVLRGMASHSTGLMSNGWAFTGGLIYRWANEGAWDGTFYNSWGYYFGAEKVFNERHSLSLTTFGSPTERGQQGATTQEVYDLAGSIYYNPYWGNQAGKKRNARVVNSYDPTVVVSHEWKIDPLSRLVSGVGFHYNTYSSTALNFYNAPDPRPDYYRNLPSFLQSDFMKDELTEHWRSGNTNVTQIRWDDLYAANTRQNFTETDGNRTNAKYSVEERHSNLMEIALNSTYNKTINRFLKLSAGVNAKYSKGMYYKTMSDLMGGKFWMDTDQFAERDFPGNGTINENDLRNPGRVINEGDRFGYSYDINVVKTDAFVQNQWDWGSWNLNYAAKLAYTNFWREGHYQNGRAPENSYGKSKSYWFLDPSFKVGASYKFDGRHWITASGLIESRAPLANNSYVSPRIKDTRLPYLNSEKIASVDLGYNFLFPRVKGRVSVFNTNIWDAAENNGFFDDQARTFVNFVMTKMEKRYSGIEAAINFKINNNFGITAAGTFADYRYTNNAIGVKSYENGSAPDEYDLVLTKDLKINSGPQAAGSITLDYRHEKMWFADITLNYFANNYIDIAPSRFTLSTFQNLYNGDQEIIKELGTQEKFNNGFLLDASVGKLIYLPKRRSININFSINNILNNTQLKTGGFQQGRLPLAGTAIDKSGLDRFPNKYYFAQGFNVFLNMGYRF